MLSTPQYREMIRYALETNPKWKHHPEGFWTRHLKHGVAQIAFTERQKTDPTQFRFLPDASRRHGIAADIEKQINPSEDRRCRYIEKTPSGYVDDMPEGVTA